MIFFILVIVNAAMLIDSSISASNRTTRATPPAPNKSDIKIYPIDLQQSKYKKAI